MAADIRLVDRHGRAISSQDTAHFAASRRAREFANWNPPSLSADAENYGETGTIADRAYDLDRNHPIAAGAIRTNVDNIVGTGLRLAAKPDYRAIGRDSEWADEWARDVEAKWRSFADALEFDAARQLTFGGMTVMQLRTAFLSGDALALALWLPPSKRPGAKWSTCLQAIDPARLACPDGRFMTDRNRQGIEINEYGEPIAYWIRKTHPGDLYGIFDQANNFERVAARTRFGRRKVLHLYDKLRPGQSRGKSIMTQVMGAFRMLDHYQRIELQTAVINSMIAAFVETPLNGQDIAEMFGGGREYVEAKSGWEVKLEGAGIIPLYPGEKMNPFNPGRPNSAYSSFVETVLRTVSTGINMPYELLMKDFSKTNYSSARAALLEAWRFFMSRRHWLATYWCNPVYELWLEEAVNAGEIEAPDFYENRAAYCRAKWIGPGRGWIDPLKEAQASELRMKTVSTMEMECAEQGLDWEEVIDQRAKEEARTIKAREAYGLGPEGEGGEPAAPGAPDPDSGDDTSTDRPEDTGDDTAAVDAEAFRQRVDAYGIAVRAGVITPQREDEEYFRRMAGAPALSGAASSTWEKEPVRRPITLAPPPGSEPSAPGQPAPDNEEPDDEQEGQE